MIPKKTIILLAVLLFTSCSSNTLEDCREEAAGITLSLLKEMEAIHTHQDLIERLPKLKKLFNKLVDVAIVAHEIKIQQQADIPIFSQEDRQLSDSIRTEMFRLYSIDGARDLVEKTQQEALYRLDAFLQSNTIFNK